MAAAEQYDFDSGRFADQLVKMAQNHYARQGARVTRAVKVAHMGQIMARRSLEKRAGIGGKLVGTIASAGSDAKKLLKNVPKPTAGGVKMTPIKQVGTAAPRPPVKTPTSAPRPAAPAPAGRVSPTAPTIAAPRPGATTQPGRVSPSAPTIAARPGAVTQAGKVSPTAPTAQMRAPARGAAPAPTPSSVSAGPTQPPSASSTRPGFGGVPEVAAGARSQGSTVDAGKFVARKSGAIRSVGELADEVKQMGYTNPNDIRAYMLGRGVTRLDGKSHDSIIREITGGAATPGAAARGSAQGPPTYLQHPPPSRGAAQGPPTMVEGAQPPPGWRPPPQSPPSAGGAAPSPGVAAGEVAPSWTPPAGGVQEPQPGFLRRMYEGIKSPFRGAVGEAVPEGAGFVQKGLHHAGGVAAGAAGYAPSAGHALAGAGALAAGRGILGAVRRGLGNRSMKRQISKAIKQTSGEAVGTVDDVANLGLRNIGGEAMQQAVEAGMSPRQLHAVDDLFEHGADMAPGVRKQLEQAAGMSYADISRAGGASEAIAEHGARSARQVRASAKPKGRAGEVAAEGVETAGEVTGGEEQPGIAGRVKNYLTRPLGGPGMQIGLAGLGIGVPLVGGLGAYGLYQGMTGLANANRQTAYQQGAYGAPINYSPTSMFPAGQIAY